MKSGIFEIPDIVVVTKCDIKNLSEITYSDYQEVKLISKIKMIGK